MYIWVGIILMARCNSTANNSTTIKNDLRYKVLSIMDEAYELVHIDDGGEEKGERSPLTEAELASKMRLTHAITYFSSQARTITGGLRLADTNSRRFTIRHLIVGLGRAPNGCDVQVD